MDAKGILEEAMGTLTQWLGGYAYLEENGEQAYIRVIKAGEDWLVATAETPRDSGCKVTFRINLEVDEIDGKE